jgi:hypothetical protein
MLAELLFLFLSFSSGKSFHKIARHRTAGPGLGDKSGPWALCPQGVTLSEVFGNEKENIPGVLEERDGAEG